MQSDWVFLFLLTQNFSFWLSVLENQCINTGVLMIKTLNKSTFVLNPIQDEGRGQKAPATSSSFSPVTSTNVGISLQNYLAFTFNIFATLVPVPNYWTWTKTTPQKRRFFWSNPYNIEVVITSLIEMLQLPNFGHMNTSTI